MSGLALFKSGKLQEAIDAQIKEVKSKPADPGPRLLLFELFAFAGDLERARRQIEAVHYGEPERDAAAATYRALLGAEQARRQLFTDGKPPQFLADPPEHVRLRLEAVDRLRAQRPAEAAELLQTANASFQVKGVLNGKPFDSLRDEDDLFAGVLEVMANGIYYWVPLEQVQALTVAAPESPRDLLWASARLEMDGAAGGVHLPVLYPGSHEHPDDQIRLGRLTDWKPSEDGPILGVGQHAYVAGDEPISLLEWRQLQMQ